ncbi:hypothetical protein Rcae01_05841 [Novipirellula caenicola]|uniref:Uncharacterized protein n=1 Tax=Novipirellula caenicola TaxID=1536901 RepID=A0ABP9W1I6_9BACT
MIPGGGSLSTFSGLIAKRRQITNHSRLSQSKHVVLGSTEHQNATVHAKT